MGATDQLGKIPRPKQAARKATPSNIQQPSSAFMALLQVDFLLLFFVKKIKSCSVTLLQLLHTLVFFFSPLKPTKTAITPWSTETRAKQTD